VLLQRQRDRILPKFPIWDDVETFDGRPWRGIVDVVCGGFPCQDISIAGKGCGIRGVHSGLWAEFARIIGEVQSPLVFVENSPMLNRRGLDVILGDLSNLGYDARWKSFSASQVGAGHKRKRLFILAHPKKNRWEGAVCCNVERVGEAMYRGPFSGALDTPISIFNEFEQRMGEPAVFGMDNGLAHRVDRLAACGDGQVPAVVRLAWNTLMDEI
jgi:DNA (cytosine-5)-methyltransferase 1